MDGQNTPPIPEVKHIWNFSPRADITPLEAAHVGVLMATFNQFKDLAEHPSWKHANRHFELTQVPVSVETQGHEQAAQQEAHDVEQSHDGNGAS